MRNVITNLEGVPVSSSRSLWVEKSVLVFLLVGFGVPWTGWTIFQVMDLEFVGVMSDDGSSGGGVLPFLLIYSAVACSLGGFIGAYVDRGTEGLRSMLRRLLLVKVGIRWWVYAFFVPLLYSIVALVAIDLLCAEYPGVSAEGLLLYITPSILLAFTTGPLCEEFGWRGFLLPKLLEHYSPFVASVILGLLWSVWHFPLYVDEVFATAEQAILFTLLVLGFSLLITNLHVRTGGSLLLIIVFHWTINVSPSIARAVLPNQPDASPLLFNDFQTGLYQLGAVFAAVLIVLAAQHRWFFARNRLSIP